MWFSIFSRPPSTRFTRVQRCTCCFVLLFMTMLLNILYYDQAAASQTSGQGLTLGSVHIASEQVGSFDFYSFPVEFDNVDRYWDNRGVTLIRSESRTHSVISAHSTSIDCLPSFRKVSVIIEIIFWREKSAIVDQRRDRVCYFLGGVCSSHTLSPW